MNKEPKTKAQFILEFTEALKETVYLFVVDSDGTASDGYEGYFIDGTFYSAGYSTSQTIYVGGNVQVSNGVRFE